MIRRPLALATLLLTFAVPATAQAHKIEFALQDDAVFVEQNWMTRDKALEHAQQLGTKRIRVNLLWARILTSGADAKTPPAAGAQYDFTKIDELQRAAQARGIKLQLT